MAVRILVIEDNEVNRVLMRDIMFMGGYEVLEAINGEEGIRLAREQRPDLIITDIQLPILDGISAARILKEDPLTCDIPIVAVSSYAYQKEKELFQATGGNVYLTKPVDVETVLKTVANLLKGEITDGG